MDQLDLPRLDLSATSFPNKGGRTDGQLRVLCDCRLYLGRYARSVGPKGPFDILKPVQVGIVPFSSLNVFVPISFT